MKTHKDLTGMVFGRLTVIKLAWYKKIGNEKGERPFWECKCSCGNTTYPLGKNLTKKNSGTKSCGCIVKEKIKQYNQKDGNCSHRQTSNGKVTPTYRTWQNMKQRCLNPKLPNYKDYGGRGITITKRWLIFENFFEDMGERPIRLTIERKNNELGYFKENCCWASRKEQAQNRRTAVFPGERINIKNRKPVKQIDKQTGETIKIHASVRIAAKCIGINESTITAVASGYKQHKTSGGYKWEYV